jgi:nucleoside-diphosphate-sugar epimerase
MLDTSRAAERFGFRATTTFAAGLAETVAWYEARRRDAMGSSDRLKTVA